MQLLDKVINAISIYFNTKLTSGIGSGSGSGTNSNGVNTAFAFGVNVGGGAARKTPSLPPLMLTPSPMKPNNRQVLIKNTTFK